MPINHPNDIPGCVMCCLVDSLIGRLANGARILFWEDESGNGNHWTCPSPTHGPQYIEFDSEFGWPTLNSAGGISVALDGAGLSLSEAESLLVVKAAADPATALDNSGHWGFGSAGFGGHLPFTDGIIYESFGTTNRKTVGNPTPSLALTRRYRVVSAPSDFKVWLDNTQIFSTTTNTVGWKATRTLFENEAGHSYAGRIFAIVVYDHVLSSTERTDLETWMTRYQQPYVPYVPPSDYFYSDPFDIENVQFVDFNILQPANGSEVEVGFVDIVWDTPTTTEPLPPGTVIEYEIEVDYGNGVFITLAVGVTDNTIPLDLNGYIGADITVRVIASLGTIEIDDETTFTVLPIITPCVLIEPEYVEVIPGQGQSCSGIDASYTEDTSITPTFDGDGCGVPTDPENCP